MMACNRKFYDKLDNREKLQTGTYSPDALSLGHNISELECIPTFPIAELHENLPITSEGRIFWRCPAPVSLQPQAWGLDFRRLDSPYLGRSCRNILQTLMNQGACGGSEGLEIHFCSPKSVNKT